MNALALWPFKNRVANLTAQELLAERTGTRIGRTTHVGRRTAMQNSTVWACTTLRADLVSQMPLDVFTKQGGIQRETAPPPVLVKPSPSYDFDEWMWVTQFEQDSCGTAVGKILAFDGAGRPAIIEPVPVESWTVRKVKGVVEWRVDNEVVPESQLWIERAYPIAGYPIGLSPIANMALSLGNWKDASEFASTWFQNKAIPGGHLKNVARVLKRRQSAAAKESFKAAVQAGDIWVSGSDWTYEPLAAKASEAAFLEVIGATDTDICRFLGVPGDMVDVATKGQAITYANITQRNLQFLITKLGPAITKRERRFSNRLLPRPQFAKLNTASLLRMDTASLYAALGQAITTRQLAPSEARELMERNPFTDEQLNEFAVLFPNKAPTPAQNPTDGGPKS